jgi:hypothetical protein
LTLGQQWGLPVRSIAITLLSLVTLTLTLAVPVQGKDDKPGHGHGGPSGKGAAVDRDRSTVYGYYRTEYLAGNCPPGLAKKGSGCLPPGQAKKIWVVGQPLPPTIVYEPLPPALVTQLTPPPPGYEYVRVDNDVLLMEIANRMIGDMIADIGDFD